MEPQESDQHARERQQSDDAFQQLKFHAELNAQTPEAENSQAKKDERQANRRAANETALDQSATFGQSEDHRGEFLKSLKPEDRTAEKAERVLGPREEQIAEAAARQVEDRVKVAVSGAVAPHESSLAAVHGASSHSQGEREGSSASQIASSLAEEAIRQDPNIHPALKDKLRHQVALNVGLSSAPIAKSGLKEFEAKFERLRDRLRHGSAKRHPLIAKDLEKVRGAVRASRHFHDSGPEHEMGFER